MTSLRRVALWSITGMLCGFSITVQAASREKQVKPGSAVPPAPAKAAAQSNAAAAMLDSIEKQKSSVRTQAGTGSSAAPFFTTPWLTPPSLSLPPQCEPMAEADLAPIVKDATAKADLSPDLVLAVIRQESASFACAVSDKGAKGLMQLMPDVAQQFGVDPFDAKENIRAGTSFLKQLLTKYKGDRKLALAAYNAGAAKVDAAGGVPEIPETQAYVSAILQYLDSTKAASAATDVSTITNAEKP